MKTFTKGLFKLLAWVGGLLLVFIAVMRIFFVDVAVVGHNAMAPTLEAGDQVLIWRNGEPNELGDITICPHPERPNELVVGRVVAKGGMVIRTDDRGQLEIAGTVPDRDWQGTERFEDSVEERTETMRRALVHFGNDDHWIYEREGAAVRLSATEVPDGKVYLLGDNRTHVGQDSRYFGAVDPATCIGTVFMRLAPASDSPNELGHGYLDILD